MIDLFSDFQLGGMGVAAVDFLNLWVISDCCCEGEGDEVYRGIVEAYHDVRACPPFPPLPPPSLLLWDMDRSNYLTLYARPLGID